MDISGILPITLKHRIFNNTASEKNVLHKATSRMLTAWRLSNELV